MKSFLKYLLATIVGIIIVHVILFFVFIGLVGAIASFSSPSIEIKDNTILKLSLKTAIPDRASENPLQNFNLTTMNSEKQIGLNKILEYIDNASKDSRIRGIYLDLTEINSNFGALATIEEIRNALLRFKQSGKFIYSYTNLGYSQKSYYLATVADSVFVNPETPLLLTGMSANISFYKDLLKKIGVQPEVIRVGKFKAAVEPYIETHMSDANREQVQTYLGSLWGNIVKGISASRNIPVEKINRITDDFKIYPVEEFVKEGFFDGALYEYAMLDKLREACGLIENEKLSLTSFEDYTKVTFPTVNFAAEKIAVIYAQGNIEFQQGPESIGPELATTIRKAREDKNIKAIVLRVNSPGGSALTSDIIWREVELATQTKPVIVSMGNVAASGGYYISCAADTIVAEPTTLTGSIGIFGMFFSGEKLIEDKMGIHTDVVKTNDHSDFGGSYPLPLPVSNRALTPYERNVLQNYVNQGYETFLSRVMSGRGLTHDELHAIAQGRVWTGEDALKIGLVDVLGGLEDAIRIAAQKAGIEKYNLTEYPVVKSPIEELFAEFTTEVKARLLKEELGTFYTTWEQMKNKVENQGLLARIPYDIAFN